LLSLFSICKSHIPCLKLLLWRKWESWNSN
jgi:hypothetical protein